MGRWSWLLLCALLPVSGEWIAIPLVLAVVALFVSRVGRPFTFDRHVLWPLFAFYALHVLGMAWSTDVDFGLFDLQIKLGLVLLPLAAAALAADHGTSALRESMVAFAAGTVVAIILGLNKAFTCFGERGWMECFTQSYLSFDLHPSYAAWYAAWAMTYWSYALITGQLAANWRWPVIAFLVIASAFTVMLASKSGLLCLALVLVMVVAMIVRRLSGGLRWKVLLALLVMIAVPGFLLAPVLASRTGAAIRSVERLLNGTADIYNSDNGNDERLVAWMCSTELIRQDAIGAGTGDIKHALVACYEAKGARHAADRRLNSHSQFLQGGVALGWIGLASALLVGLVPLWIAVRRRGMLLTVFMLLFLLNAAIESVLEVQAGVVFFALVLGLLASRERSSPA